MFEAVRRPYVVTVGIPLRRVTILGLLLSVPTLFLHQQIEHLREGIRESFGQPEWIWIAIAAALLFLISQSACDLSRDQGVRTKRSRESRIGGGIR